MSKRGICCCVGDFQGQVRAVVGHVHIELVAAMKINACQINRRSGWRSAVGVKAGGVIPLSIVVGEIEFDRDAVGNAWRSSRRRIGAVAKSAPRRTDRGGVVGLHCECEPICRGIRSRGKQKAKVRGEVLNVDWDVVPGRRCFIGATVRHAQGAAIELGVSDQGHASRRETAREIDGVDAPQINGVQAAGDRAVAEIGSRCDGFQCFCRPDGNGTGNFLRGSANTGSRSGSVDRVEEYGVGCGRGDGNRLHCGVNPGRGSERGHSCLGNQRVGLTGHRTL